MISIGKAAVSMADLSSLLFCHHSWVLRIGGSEPSLWVSVALWALERCWAEMVVSGSGEKGLVDVVVDI